MDGLLPESIPLDFQWTLNAGILQILNVSLSAGDNVLSLATGTKLIIVVPPTTNAATLKLKGVIGDTGFTIRSSEPNPIPWTTGSVLINASALVTGTVIYLLG